MWLRNRRWLNIMGLDTAAIRDHFNLDPRKKTVLVVDTNDDIFFGEDAPWKVREPMERGIVELTKAYNVILSLHPMSFRKMEEKVKMLASKGVHVNYGETARGHSKRGPPFPSVVPFWEVADVIVGPSSGALHQATYNPSLPIVLYRPSRYGKNCRLKKVLSKPWNRHVLLGPENAVIFDERDIDLVCDVSRALADSQQLRKTEARRHYFQRFNGNPDGYEDYRQQLCFLDHHLKWIQNHKPHQREDFERRLHRLKSLYRDFPNYRNQPLRDPTLACHDFVEENHGDDFLLPF